MWFNTTTSSHVKEYGNHSRNFTGRTVVGCLQIYCLFTFWPRRIFISSHFILVLLDSVGRIKISYSSSKLIVIFYYSITGKFRFRLLFPFPSPFPFIFFLNLSICMFVQLFVLSFVLWIAVSQKRGQSHNVKVGKELSYNFISVCRVKDHTDSFFGK